MTAFALTAHAGPSPAAMSDAMTEPALSAASSSSAGPGPALAITHFTFDSRVFQLEEAVFSLGEDRQTPLFSVPLGDMVGRLTLPTVRRTFEIPAGSRDDQLLNLVEKGLQFVKAIRPGDALPNELLDGTASWSVEAIHRQRATLRVLRQLVTFAGPGQTGAASDALPDAAILLMREAVADGIARYWRAGPEAHALIDQRIGRLMDEVAYIEALGDLFEGLLAIDRRLRQALPQVPSSGSPFDYTRALPMMAKPKRWGRAMLAEVDAHVLDALVERRGFADRMAAIQAARNALHFELRDWCDLIDAWKTHTITSGSPETETLLRETYRFLLQRYPLQRSWVSRNGDGVLIYGD